MVDAKRVNGGDKLPVFHGPIGCFPTGASPFEVEELSGTIGEWTRSLWGPTLQKPTFRYPYNPADGRENLVATPDVARVVRGGSPLFFPEMLRAARRQDVPPTFDFGVVGFRVALCQFTKNLGVR